MASIGTRSLISAILFAWLGMISSGCRAQRASNPQPPTTILIVRHAEKLDDGEANLSPAGAARAGLLPQMFGSRTDLPTPQVLFAARSTTHSDRPTQTLTPLAEALHLPIDDRFNDHQYADLAAELLSGRYAGKVVLVVWHHGRIPQLAIALGATPPYNPWPAQQYDRIWRIDYINGKATLHDLPIGLMPGDSR